MAYHFDAFDQALVVDSWEGGIADSPFAGISNMRNVNIISIPGEASVNFSTVQISPPALATGTVSSVNAGTDTITFTGPTGLYESGFAIVFSGTPPAGITAGLPYWVGNVTSNTFKVYSDPYRSVLIDITNTTTGATFTNFTINQPHYFSQDLSNNAYWVVDALGRVWANISGIVSATSSYWGYTGNRVPNTADTNGNGLGYYQSSTGVGYIFVIHNSSIDYTPVATIAWSYQWDPTTGISAGYNATPTRVLNNLLGVKASHEVCIGQDNVFYFCDASFLGSFFEVDAGVFDPTNTATYTYNKQALALPTLDNANCLAELGTTLLVGGQFNKIYPWDRLSTSFRYPLLLAENVISKMITINTNTFIFVGNRGRIYITNGTNAQLWKKIPDHISGTIEPYYTWGGVTNTKNQIYFGALVKTNSGGAISQYGGIWAIDVDSEALRLTNQLSYGTYAGYPTAMIAIVPPVTNPNNNPLGTGLYIGWDNGSSGYGLDGTSTNPYTGSQAMIDSDLIPIGTFNKPRDFQQVEYRLTRPLVSGESILIKTRLIFNTSDTGYTTTLTDSTVGNYSSMSDINFRNAQWVQFQIILNSTLTTPSYTRLKEIRILGLTGPTIAQSQQLSL